MIRKTVTECRLRVTVSGGELVVPVTRFSVSFRINDIPVADIVPSTGKSIVTGRTTDLSLLSEDDEGVLELVVDGDVITLFRGNFEDSSASDNATPFSRRKSSLLRFVHTTGKLRGMPNSSVEYLTAGYMGWLNPIGLDAYRLNIPAAQPDMVFPEGSFLQEIMKKDPTMAGNPGKLMAYITQKLETSFYGSALFTGANLRWFEGASMFATLQGSTLPVAAYVHKAYIQDWLRRTCWDGILSACSGTFTYAMPYSTGMILGDPFPMRKTPQITITPDQYTDLTISRQGMRGPKLSGAVIMVPGVVDGVKQSVNEALIWYPKDVDAVNLPREKFWYKATIPEWAQYMARNALQSPSETKVSVVRPGALGGSLETVSREKFLTLGEAIARAVWAMKMAENDVFQLRGPFRTDLMPGTVIAVKGDRSRPVYSGETLYGMIGGVTFTGGLMAGKAWLDTTADIVAGRTENENGKYAFDGHPLFETEWPGIDLNGTYLTDYTDPQAFERVASRNLVGVPTGTSSNRTVRDEHGQIQTAD